MKYLLYNNELWEPYLNFEYKGRLDPFTLQPDTYLFIADGATGGRFRSSGNQFVSYGGRAYGILDLDHTQQFYANVGGNGGDSTFGTTRALGGYNGGGDGGLSSSRDNNQANGCGGGGATDVRLSSQVTEYIEEDVTVPPEEDLVQVEYISTSWADTEDPWAVVDPTRTPQPTHNSAGAWIDTGYAIKSNSVIEMTVRIDRNDSPFETPTPAIQNYFGVSSGQNDNLWFQAEGFDYFVMSYHCGVSGHGGDSNLADFPTTGFPKNQIVTFRISGNRFTINDREVVLTEGDSTRSDSPDTHSFFVFNRHVCNHIYGSDMPNIQVPEGNLRSARMRLYEIKIWENDELIHWMVPVATNNTSKGAYYYIYRRGMYDLVTETFHQAKKLCHDTSSSAPRAFYPYPDDWLPADSSQESGNWFIRGPQVGPDQLASHHKRLKQIVRGVSSRIFVAGGGGGTSFDYNSDVNQDFMSWGGGKAGGTIAGPNITSNNNGGLRATQDSGYEYGKGQSAEDRDPDPNSTRGTSSGQGGGGGGWYGGYSVFNKRYSSIWTSYGGTGGSSYILTEDSYKPEGYMDGFEDIIPTLYFRNGLMLPYQAFDGPSLKIYKRAQQRPVLGDTVVVPFTGTQQTYTMIPSSYKFRCYGGGGGARYKQVIASKGGYAEGILDLQQTTPLYFCVGCSAYIMATAVSARDELLDIFGPTAQARFGATGPITGLPNAPNPETQAAVIGGGGETSIRTEPGGTVTRTITVPDGTDEVQYLQSDGTNYFLDTKGTVSSTYDIECVCELLEPTGVRECIFGTWGGTVPNASTYSNALAVFPVWDASNPGVAFLCGTKLNKSSLLMPYNQKIKITIVDNVLSWYDMEDNLLGSITSSSARPSGTSTALLWFDCTRGWPAGASSGTDPMGANTIARIYSYKLINHSSGALFRHFVPCSNAEDETGPKFYDLMNRIYATRADSGNNFIAGAVVEPKTSETYSYSNELASRNSRIMVAGAGGAQGGPDGRGGNGGGLSGEACKGSASDGTNKGPGTQDSGYGFGIGGIGSYNMSTGKYLGAGGNGWYGGYATTGGINSDTNKGGSGGSGYVLTSSSYKPTDYTPDERFWMRDTVLTTGGNTTQGKTWIEFEVVEEGPEPVQVLSVLAKDKDGYKAYDESSDSWYSITLSGEIITIQEFIDYGVPIDVIISDDGLSFPYKLCVCDSFATGISGVYTKVIPTTQHITFNTTAEHVSEVKRCILDATLDENASVTETHTFANSTISANVAFDLTDIPEKDSVLYMAQYRVKYKSGKGYEYNPPKKTIEDVDLYTSELPSPIPFDNKPLASDTMPDGKTEISTVVCSSACEYGRCIYYTLMLGTKIRIEKYNLFTNQSEVIRDDINPATISADGAVGGSIFIKNDNVYLTNSYSYTTSQYIKILEAPIDAYVAPIVYSSNTLGTSENYYASGCGQSYWYDDNRRIFCSMNGFMLFDVDEHTWEYKPLGATLEVPEVCSFAVGKYSIMSFSDSLSATCRIHNRETFAYVANHGITFAEEYHCCTYNDGKFYIAEPGHVYVYEDNSNNIPTRVSDILIPDGSQLGTLYPKSITCSDNCIYLTFADSDVLYTYNITENRWLSLTLPEAESALGSQTDMHRPVCFDDYFFHASKNLFVTNASMYSRYRVGETNSYVHVRTNSENLPVGTLYNPKFITVDDVGLHIHPGYLYKQLTVTLNLNDRIFATEDYLETDYRKLIKHSFTLPDDEEVYI